MKDNELGKHISEEQFRSDNGHSLRVKRYSLEERLLRLLHKMIGHK